MRSLQIFIIKDAIDKKSDNDLVMKSINEQLLFYCQPGDILEYKSDIDIQEIKTLHSLRS